MFIIKKIDRKTIIGMMLAILLIVATGVKLIVVSHTPSTAYCDSIGKYYTELNEEFSFSDFFRQFDIEIVERPVNKTEITIPSEFNTVYEKYNILQKNQGFDLAKYKGKKAIRYTFDVINDKAEYEVKANVIVFEGKIIAGDLCTYAFDGNMTTLNDRLMIQE